MTCGALSVTFQWIDSNTGNSIHADGVIGQFLTDHTNPFLDKIDGNPLKFQTKQTADITPQHKSPALANERPGLIDIIPDHCAIPDHAAAGSAGLPGNVPRASCSQKQYRIRRKAPLPVKEIETKRQDWKTWESGKLSMLASSAIDIRMNINILQS